MTDVKKSSDTDVWEPMYENKDVYEVANNPSNNDTTKSSNAYIETSPDRIPDENRKDLQECITKTPMEFPCDTHPETVKFYCETCSVMICEICLYTEHKDHQWTLLKYYGTNQRKNVNDIKKAAAEAQRDIQNVVNKAKFDIRYFKTFMTKQKDSIAEKKKEIESNLNQVALDLVQSVEKAEKVASHFSFKFVERQELRLSKIKRIIYDVEHKQLDNENITKYFLTLEKILEDDPYLDVSPNLEKVKHIVKQGTNTELKTKISELMGCLGSPQFANYEAKLEAKQKIEILYSHFLENENIERNLVLYKTFSINTPVKFIAPYNINEAVLGNAKICHVEIGSEQTNLITSLPEIPLAVAVDTSGVIILATSHPTHLLAITKSTFRSIVEPQFNVENLQVQCLFVSGSKLLVCGQVKPLPEGVNTFEIWSFTIGDKNKDVRKQKIQIDEEKVTQITHMCKSENQRIGLVCKTDKYSWLVVLNSDLETLYKYPKNYKYLDDIQIVGAGFLSNSDVTVCCRTFQEQHLVDDIGVCRWKRKLSYKPVYCAVDPQELIWIACDDGIVDIYKL